MTGANRIKYGTQVLMFIIVALCAGFIKIMSPVPSVCWRLVSIQTDSLRKMPGLVKPQLVIKDSTFSGYSGCNYFIGKSSIKSDTLIFDRATATKKGCPSINWIEDALFHQLFRGKVKYTIKNDSLILYGKKYSIFKFIKSTDPDQCNDHK